jgi:hypothetical protein
MEDAASLARFRSGGNIEAVTPVLVTGVQASVVVRGAASEETAKRYFFLFWRFETRSSTTAGSASVEVSPSAP